MNPIIQIKNLNFSYNNKKILDNINLEVHEKEIVTIIGPNGSGKSTLAKIIIKSLVPEFGEIIYKENIKMAYMPQKINFSKTIPMTVKHFLKLFTSDWQNICRQTLNYLKVDSLLNQQISEISGGQVQRTMFAATLLQKPNFLILDEPLQAIDNAGQIEFYQIIEHLRDEHNITIFLISHDLHTVMARTDRVICLNSHICCYGKPSDVTENPEYIKLFNTGEAKYLGFYKHNHDHKH